jgi:hypothetical protein
MVRLQISIWRNDPDRYMPVLDAILSFKLDEKSFVAMGQMTVGQQHPISSSKASEYCGCLGKSVGKEVILLFAVPCHGYASVPLFL